MCGAGSLDRRALMGWHDMDGSDWAWMTVMMITFWAVIIAAVIMLVRRGGNREPTVRDTPETTLQHRLARGEIAVEEYNQRLDALKRVTKP